MPCKSATLRAMRITTLQGSLGRLAARGDSELGCNGCSDMFSRTYRGQVGHGFNPTPRSRGLLVSHISRVSEEWTRAGTSHRNKLMTQTSIRSTLKDQYPPDCKRR